MLRIPKEIVDEIVFHAKAEAPDECCGLLAGRGGEIKRVYRIANLPSDDPQVADLKVRPDRRFRYVMDPKEQLSAFKSMRKEGLELVAIYHSHPHSQAYPSTTDVRLAYYPEVYYLIISLEAPSRSEVRAFRIVDQRITEEKIEVLF